MNYLIAHQISAYFNGQGVAESDAACPITPQFFGSAPVTLTYSVINGDSDFKMFHFDLKQIYQQPCRS